MLGALPAGAAQAGDLSTPTLGDRSAYTLTEVPAGADGAAPAGDNIITKFEYNAADGSFTPKYYQLNLKQTTYGEGNASYQVEVNTPTDPVTVTINYNDGASGVYDRVYSDVLLELKETNLEGTSEDSYQLEGGAVKVPNFSGDVLFANNKTDATLHVTADSGDYYVDALGGALNNTGSIDSISGAFINNSITATVNDEGGYDSRAGISSYGGALYNSGNINNINADFIGNYTTVPEGSNGFSYGGAIANRAYTGGGDPAVAAAIGDITGDFIGNSAGRYGGAIYNEAYSYTDVDAIASIGDITGDFIGNSAGDYGGAIYNEAHCDTAYKMGDATIKAVIGDITGDFIGNDASAIGGAIFNRGTIGDITGDFIGNTGRNAGAIYNYVTIGDITGDFIGNSAKVDNNFAQGGAIYNLGTIGDITGDFIGNYATGPESAIGGAIYINNYNPTVDNINSITGDFIGNYAAGTNGSIGGAISVQGGIISDITSDFIGNYAKSDNLAYGGAVSNFGYSTRGENGETYYAQISKITGDFIGNYASGSNGAIGGALMNWSISQNQFTIAQISDIAGNFTGNYAQSETGTAQGGAIANTSVDDTTLSSIGNIAGNFTGNYAQSETGTAQGGAIYNTDLISSVQGEFRNNYAQSETGTAQGGAIYNQITPSETQIVYQNLTIVITDADGNTVDEKTLCMFTTDSDILPVDAALALIKKGAAVTTNEESLKVTQEEYDNQYRDSFEAYFDLGWMTDKPVDIPTETSNITISNSLFADNKAVSEGDAAGGALANVIPDYIGSDDAKVVNKVVNTSFYNNTAETTSESGEAKGGAIYSAADITIAADNGESIFSGNKVINNGVEESNAIYMAPYEIGELDESGGTLMGELNASTLTLDAKNNGLVYFDDKIDGAAVGDDRYNVELTGDGTGKIVFNNDVLNADLRTNEGANVYLGREDVLDSDKVTLNGGSLFLLNNKVGTANFDTLSISADTDLMVDVDLANSTMDRVSADSYGELKGNINVTGMNLLSDAPEGSDLTEILFADNALKNNVTYGGAELPDNFQTTAYTPIYKYNVAYDPSRVDGGYFLFTRGDKNPAGGSSGNQSDMFNPAVLGSPVSTQAANQSALNEVFKYSYEHLDAFTKLPEFERNARLNANKYAMSTEFNDNLPSYAEQLYNKGVWFKPFTTFESLPLKNGPKVDAITYGSLVGFDTDFKELGNGWHSVFSGFAGYVGSSLNYSGVDSTMNGGLLGFTETFYKDNFWTAVSATAGASVGETHNMYGKEDYTSLLAGVGSKTGYNFEFKEGRFIIQPIMYLGYTFVNTFDYKNSAGVNIESDPLHTIQINPSVRFIANLKGGWQPYASVGMVWNLMNETKATANNVRLPEMSVKPYVEYGVGVQRNWADKFTAFLQAMIRNGGRNGVSLTGGFRFMLGSDDDNTPKVKKEIKSL